MAKSRNILVLIGIILLFIYSSHSIVQTKILQLRLLLAREQLLNYELSGRMLRAKFKQMLLQKDDYATEMKLKVLESSILNFNEEQRQKLRLTPSERVGLALVNGVRGLAFKPFLRLEEEEDSLLVLQYAFYMERTRKYKEAAQKYEALEEEFSALSDENYAFILLHGGYCSALYGDTPGAIQKLEIVQKEFAGSHYETNATILLEILRENSARKEKIEKGLASDLDRARAYYSAGQFSDSLTAYKSATGKNISDELNIARSFEETGQTGEAVKQYMSLVGRPGAENVARQANRRLLMIGNFYDGGKQLKDYAEKKAEALGDTTILKDIQDSADLQLTPTVIEKIEKLDKEGSQKPESLAKLAELKKDLEETLKVEEKTVKEIVIEKKAVEKKEEEQRKLAEREQGRAYRMQIVFLDGRAIQGNSIIKEKDHIHASSGKYTIRLPFIMLKEISLPAGADQLELQLNIDGKIMAARRIRFGDEQAQITTATGESFIPTEDFISAMLVFPERAEYPLKIELATGAITFARSIFFASNEILLNGLEGKLSFRPQEIEQITARDGFTIDLFALNGNLLERAMELELADSSLKSFPKRNRHDYAKLKAAVPRKN